MTHYPSMTREQVPVFAPAGQPYAEPFAYGVNLEKRCAQPLAQLAMGEVPSQLKFSQDYLLRPFGGDESPYDFALREMESSNREGSANHAMLQACLAMLMSFAVGAPRKRQIDLANGFCHMLDRQETEGHMCIGTRDETCAPRYYDYHLFAVAAALCGHVRWRPEGDYRSVFTSCERWLQREAALLRQCLWNDTIVMPGRRSRPVTLVETPKPGQVVIGDSPANPLRREVLRVLQGGKARVKAKQLQRLAVQGVSAEAGMWFLLEAQRLRILPLPPAAELARDVRLASGPILSVYGTDRVARYFSQAYPAPGDWCHLAARMRKGWAKPQTLSVFLWGGGDCWSMVKSFVNWEDQP